MDKITLTGGTLVANPDGVPSLGGGSTHNHSHSHGHGHSHNHNAVQYVPSTASNPPLEELVHAEPAEIAQSLSTLFRFGRYEAVRGLLDKINDTRGEPVLAQVVQESDDGGHFLLHWAAKRVDDMRFLQLVLDLIAQCKLQDKMLNMPSQDNVGMMALHWACTEGSIPHIALLLKAGADIEAVDQSKCTPLLIAAQYGQAEVVAYLLKQGANVRAVDASRDTAMHWAAYKGSIQVCGLLSWNETLDFVTPDAYGQTPLHLAALRGNTPVVRYILGHLAQTPRGRDVLFAKDKNERTPLDLAIHKQRPTVEAVLREEMAKLKDPRGYFLKKTLIQNLKEMGTLTAWKQWLGLTGGADDMDEPTKFPYYFVLSQLMVHFLFFFVLFYPLYNPGSGLLWDKSGWLFMNVIFMLATWYTFYKTKNTPPGYMDGSHPHIGKWRRMYEETLDAYADEGQADKLPPLCHTCHIARPLRSKHCRINRKCVLLFDHYCPFVDNTIGLDNYKWFYGFLLSVTLGLFSFLITFLIYLVRVTKLHSFPWLTFVIGLGLSIILFPVAGMLIYHTQLTMVNLTTNEHLNVRKYKYLYPVGPNGKRQYKNPWFQGWKGNFHQRFYPSASCYEIASERQGLTATAGESGESAIEMV